MSKYEVVSNWIKTCDKITTWLYCNAILMENNSVSVSFLSENTVTPYIDGSQEKEFLFTIDFVQAYDTYQSDTNMHSIEDTQAIIDWIKSQTTLPDFGDGFETYSVEIDEQVPGILVDQDLSLCKYQFNCKIKFFQE